MLSSPITVTYNTVAYDLIRTNEQNYSSEYFFRSAALDLKLQIGHSLPKKGGDPEAHVVTLWATHYVDGEVTRVERVYERLATDVGKQDSAAMVDLRTALNGFMATNAAAIVDRAS